MYLNIFNKNNQYFNTDLCQGKQTMTTVYVSIWFFDILQVCSLVLSQFAYPELDIMQGAFKRYETWAWHCKHRIFANRWYTDATWKMELSCNAVKAIVAIFKTYVGAKLNRFWLPKVNEYGFAHRQRISDKTANIINQEFQKFSKIWFESFEMKFYLSL